MYITTHQNDTTKHVFNVKLIPKQFILKYSISFDFIVHEAIITDVAAVKARLEDEESSTGHYPHSV